MLRPVRLVLTLASVFVCAAQPCFAARQDAGAFSAELPDGWTMAAEGDLTTFAEPSGPLELMVMLKKYPQDADIKEVVEEMAGQTPVKMLADNIYIYEDASGGRGWSMLAADGTFADVSANMDYVDMKDFLAGLKAAAAEKGLDGIFKTLASSEEAAEWLLFTTPAFAEQPDDEAGAGDGDGDGDGDTEDSDELAEGEDGTPFEHKTFTAIVPTGWTAAEQGESVVFASDAKDGFVIVRVFTLESDDDKAFAAWAKEQTKAFGAKNITVGEGVVEFDTEKGANGMFTLFDTKSLFLLFGGDSPKIDNLIKSIGLAE